MHVFDDFREAYSWLRHNTPEDAKVGLTAGALLGTRWFFWAVILSRLQAPPGIGQASATKQRLLGCCC